MLAAAFDIGTTAVKAAVVQHDGSVVYTDSAKVMTIETGSFREQSPEQWYEAFCEISRRMTKALSGERIQAIVFSGQMQDVIAVGADGKAVRNAILYSDGRAECEAEEIRRALSRTGDPADGEALLMEITGNHFDGSMPLAKIRWMKKYEPERYEKTAKFLISSKDYVVGQLTGEWIGDVTACATAGAMELSAGRWSETVIAAAGVDIGKFPELLHSHETAGRVTAKAAAETGYPEGTRVFAGTGDAGATTLASGILAEGEYNINLGTSSWVAAVSGGFMACAGGGFNLSAMQENLYINVVPFFNGGNVHRFLGTVFSDNGDGAPDYRKVSELLKNSVPGSHGVFFLPYLAGERFPVMDCDVRGGYLGLSQETTAADLARSALEGVACSIRQGLELFDAPVRKLTLIGGGAREPAWCQILCDVIGTKLYVYRDPELLPALAIAASAFLAEGLIGEYGEFTEILERKGNCVVLTPDAGASAVYEAVYEKYKKIYPLVRDFYGSRRQ